MPAARSPPRHAAQRDNQRRLHGADAMADGRHQQILVRLLQLQSRLPHPDAALGQARAARRQVHRRAGEGCPRLHPRNPVAHRSAHCSLRRVMAQSYNYPKHPLFGIAPILYNWRGDPRHDEYTSHLVGRIRAGRYTSDLWDCNSLYLTYPERAPIAADKPRIAVKSRYVMTPEE